MPKLHLVPEMRWDLQLFDVRSILNTKTHFKKHVGTENKFTFAQAGTVVVKSSDDYRKALQGRALTAKTSSRHFKPRFDRIQDLKVNSNKAAHKSTRKRLKRLLKYS